jgi:GntP family gluconate:H+ symporter
MSALALLAVGLAMVLAGILGLRLPAFLALLLAAYGVAGMTHKSALQRHADAAVKMGDWTAGSARKFVQRPAAGRVADEFGKTCASIGVLIIMAAILGECLLRSGAAEQIAVAILWCTGAARAQLAFFLTSFLLAVPVFFDTVFYLTVPLAQATARRTGRDYLLYVMCIVAGGTITHSLVPPAPGPLYVAGELGVPIGLMMVLGGIIGLGAAGFGYFFASTCNRRFSLAVPGLELRPGTASTTPRELPPLWLSVLPVFLPVVLISLEAGAKSWPSLAGGVGAWMIALVGYKDFALTLGALIAVFLLVRQQGRLVARDSVGKALTSGATVMAIIAAGGAFGGVLRQTGIADAFGSLLGGAQALALPALFLMTALLRTAQGSATVAMITMAPIAKSLLDGGTPHVHPVYFALAIGCGSKPFPWMNDAGFWVITRLSGLREIETLRTVSPMISLQGAVGLVLTMVAAWLVPLSH